MGTVIYPYQMERMRLIKRIDYYIYRAFAAGLLTFNELKELKQKIRDKNPRERRRQQRQ
jgi:hypothetical protein